MASAHSSNTASNGQTAPMTGSGGRSRSTHSAASGSKASPRPPRGTVTRLLDLFSSIWLGVTLLVILFLYSSIGSAGILIPRIAVDAAGNRSFAWAHEQIRQWRGLEMTEFEWFHWWPFDLLIALICTNVIVATLRRIPFSTL